MRIKTGLFRNLLTPTAITMLVAIAYVLVVLYNAGGDPLAFVLLGSRFADGGPAGTEGYDGQFAYQIALNPAGAVPYLDVPAYRYQRLLYPLLARLLALGQPQAIPWALIVVNLAAIGVGTWATEKILREFRVSPWYALVYGLYGGQLAALRTDLNEPLAHALIQIAILAWLRERRWLAVLFFALAAITKETTLIFLAAYLLFLLVDRDWGWLFRLGVAGLPFVLLQLLLWRWLGVPGSWLRRGGSHQFQSAAAGRLAGNGPGQCTGLSACIAGGGADVNPAGPGRPVADRPGHRGDTPPGPSLYL
jgi:hypothetical protein